jgi:hypothetical protein
MVSIPRRIDVKDGEYIGILYPDTPHEMVVASEKTYERCERALQSSVRMLEINDEEEED